MTARAKVTPEVFHTEQNYELAFLGCMSLVLRHLRGFKEHELAPTSQYLLPLCMEALRNNCASFSKYAQNVMEPAAYALLLQERIDSLDKKLRPAAHLAPIAHSERALMGTSLLADDDDDEAEKDAGAKEIWPIFSREFCASTPASPAAVENKTRPAAAETMDASTTTIDLQHLHNDETKETLSFFDDDEEDDDDDEEEDENNEDEDGWLPSAQPAPPACANPLPAASEPAPQQPAADFHWPSDEEDDFN